MQEAPAGGFEVIVIDDGGSSTLTGIPCALQADLDVHVIRRKHSGGPGAARNTGAEAARGKLLAFTDDDCLPDPGWLRELVAALSSHPGAGAGGVTRTGLQKNPWALASQTVEDVVFAEENRLTGEATFLTTKNLAVPAASFAELGGFDQSLRICEDRDLCDRWRASGRVLVLVPAARVAHVNPRTANGFWRQHVGYGRGSKRFHAARAHRGGGGLRPNPRFYVRLLAQPLRGPATDVGRVRLLGLLVASQIASALGYGVETLAHRRGQSGTRAWCPPSTEEDDPRRSPLSPTIPAVLGAAVGESANAAAEVERTF